MRPSLMILAWSLPLCLLAQETPASQPVWSVRGDLTPNDKVKRMSLQEVLEAAASHDPRISAARGEDEALNAKADQARWAKLQGSYEGFLSPLSTFEGDAVQSDTPDFPLRVGGGIGMYTRHQITVLVPLITFGKAKPLSALSEIAQDSGEELVRRVQAEVAQDVRRAYFGALMADDVLDLLEEAQGRLNTARQEIEQDIAGGGDTFSKLDLHKLGVFEAELKARAADARAGLKLARQALALLAGSDVEVHPKEDFLAPLEGNLPGVKELLSAALNNRPEVRLLAMALNAKKAEAKLAKAFLFPDIGAFATGTFSFSNTAENQTSPFAYDPYNQTYANIGIGIRYSLDIGVKLGKARETAANEKQLASLQQAALGGISLEIEKLYNDANAAKERTGIRESGDKAARQWLIAVVSDFTVGNAETRDLMEALLASGDNHAKYLQSILEYNLAVGALSRAVGQDSVLKP